MITSDNIRLIDMPKIFNQAAKKLTGIQSEIAGRDSIIDTGHLRDFLAAGPFDAGEQNGEASLLIMYPIYTRFLDLRFRKKKPKKFVPIYNKYVWNFLMGYIYNRARAGIANYIAERLKSKTIEI